jgi:hypothetical protein
MDVSIRSADRISTTTAKALKISYYGNVTTAGHLSTNITITEGRNCEIRAALGCYVEFLAVSNKRIIANMQV